MAILTVAICEDEPYMCADLKKRIRHFFAGCPMDYTLSCFCSGEQLLKAQNRFDLILMDILLPGISGMDAAKRLREQDCDSAILFITSSKEDVFEAFEVDAVHFLVKPVDDTALFHAMKKAIRKIQEKSAGWFIITQGQTIKKIRYNDIVYFEAINHQISVNLKNNQKELFYGRISDLTGRLDPHFFHCHRSYIVNLSHVISLENETVQMSNGDRVFVSRRRRKELSERLLTFLREEMLE